MKPFILSIIHALILFTTKTLPRNRKLLIFGAWFGEKFDDNSRVLFECVINSRKDLQAYWITANKEVHSKMKGLGLHV